MSEAEQAYNSSLNNLQQTLGIQTNEAARLNYANIQLTNTQIFLKQQLEQQEEKMNNTRWVCIIVLIYADIVYFNHYCNYYLFVHLFVFLFVCLSTCSISNEYIRIFPTLYALQLKFFWIYHICKHKHNLHTKTLSEPLIDYYISYRLPGSIIHKWRCTFVSREARHVITSY